MYDWVFCVCAKIHYIIWQKKYYLWQQLQNYFLIHTNLWQFSSFMTSGGHDIVCKLKFLNRIISFQNIFLPFYQLIFPFCQPNPFSIHSKWSILGKSYLPFNKCGGRELQLKIRQTVWLAFNIKSIYTRFKLT